ncbi:MAG: hypothetical protein GQ564_08820 [Bacteroidales bacterium]|nr:hypothetical protein [Bacteroidales bacterium]
MDNNYFRYYKPSYLIAFVLISGTLISGFLSWLIPYIHNEWNISYYQFPATSIIIAGIIVLINKHLWKYKPFKFLFWIPDLNGRYEGQIEYNNPVSGKKEKKKCTIEIFQTGSKIKINSYFAKSNGKEKSPSKSLVESVVKNDNDLYSLIFTYQNEGIQGIFQPHNGTNILNYIHNKEGRFLEGKYYTNRVPQTQGEMNVKFISNNLKYDY